MSGYSIQALIEMLREPCGEPDCGHCMIERQAAEEIAWLVAEFQRLKASEAESRQEAEDLRALFDLQWTRTREADAVYVAAHQRPDYPHGYRPDLGKLIGWLLEFYRYVEALPCECLDEYGKPFPRPCERCQLLGRNQDEAAHPMLCVQHGGSPASEAENAATGFSCPKCDSDTVTVSESTCPCRQCVGNRGDKINGLPAELCLFIVCPVCGNKRCPRASDHRLACTNSNEPGQPGIVEPKLEPRP